jgi:hypothetical protein
MEAEAICGLLRTEGIACDHPQTDVGAGAGDAVGSGGPRKILVAKAHLESARLLVTDASQGAPFVAHGSFSEPGRTGAPESECCPVSRRATGRGNRPLRG